MAATVNPIAGNVSMITTAEGGEEPERFVALRASNWGWARWCASGESFEAPVSGGTIRLTSHPSAALVDFSPFNRHPPAVPYSVGI